jgi:hypothetical protein
VLRLNQSGSAFVGSKLAWGFSYLATVASLCVALLAAPGSVALADSNGVALTDWDGLRTSAESLLPVDTWEAGVLVRTLPAAKHHVSRSSSTDESLDIIIQLHEITEVTFTYDDGRICSIFIDADAGRLLRKQVYDGTSFVALERETEGGFGTFTKVSGTGGPPNFPDRDAMIQQALESPVDYGPGWTRSTDTQGGAIAPGESD